MEKRGKRIRLPELAAKSKFTLDNEIEIPRFRAIYFGQWLASHVSLEA
jgi:hypothetical protein